MALSGRAEGHSNVFRRWLTDVLVCSRCGAGLKGDQQAKGRPHRYWCATRKGGCGGIDGPAAEQTVQRLILDYLAKPSNLDALQAGHDSDRLGALRREVAEDENQLVELADLWAAKSISTPEYLVARRTIEERLAGAKVLVRRSLPGAVQRMLAADDLEEAWHRTEPNGRREVARVIFPSGIRVHPHAGDRFRGFDEERLDPIDWKKPENVGVLVPDMTHPPA